MAATLVAFVDLLAETREYLKRYLAGQLSDPSSQETAPDGAQESRAVGMLVFLHAMSRRDLLFAFGREHGLSEREITVALLRPLAPALRPTLARSGCTCPRCQYRTSRAA